MYCTKSNGQFFTDGDNISNASSNSSGRGDGAKAGGATGGRERSSRSHKSDQKTTRVRTVMNEKQLHTLRTCYGANPRPDALMKEQLVEMTGLSSRVIRVWFQNKRCKDKKRNVFMQSDQQQLQDKVRFVVAYNYLDGPLVRIHNGS